MPLISVTWSIATNTCSKDNLPLAHTLWVHIVHVDFSNSNNVDTEERIIEQRQRVIL